MKKLTSLVLVIVLMLSLAACGGNSEPSSTPPSSTVEASTTPASTVESMPSKPASTSAPATTKYDTEKMEDEFTEAYMGLADSGETVYYAGTEDGSLALLMFLDPETELHYVFVGPIVHNDNGTFTITDEIDEVTLTFEAEETDEGLWFDFGDLGEAVLEECTVEEALDAILTIEASTNSILDNGDEDSAILSQDLSIINSTAVDIHAMYISPSDTDEWQEDVLGDLVLEAGETLEVTFDLSEDTQYWDLMIEDSVGDSLIWTELDLFSITEIELLFEDGEAIANTK